MTSWTSFALIALAGIPAARVQDKAQGSDSGAKPAAEAKPAAGSRAERLAAIKKEFDDARRAFSKAYQAAKTPEEREKLQYPDPKTWTSKVWDLVHENSTDDAGFDGLSWIVQMNPSRQELEDALTLLLNDHVKNPKIGDLCPSLASNIQFEPKLLARIVSDNPDHSAKGQALYALGTYTAEVANAAKTIASGSEEEKNGLKEYVGEARYAQLKALNPDETEIVAGKMLDMVVADYADVKGGRSTLGEAAKGDLHELRDLQIGRYAPNIEGEDLTGAQLKLWDYRGKVVLLDFWGNW